MPVIYKRIKMLYNLYRVVYSMRWIFRNTSSVESILKDWMILNSRILFYMTFFCWLDTSQLVNLPTFFFVFFVFLWHTYLKLQHDLSSLWILKNTFLNNQGHYMKKRETLWKLDITGKWIRTSTTLKLYNCRIYAGELKNQRL